MGTVVCVVGSSGFIGSAIVDRLLEKKVKVIPLPVRSSLACDATNVGLPSWLDELLYSIEFDYIVNCVSPRPAQISEEKKWIITSSGLSPLSIVMSLAARRKLKKIIHLSTGAVYGLSPVPFNEDSVVDSSTGYAFYHLLAERYLASLGRRYNCQHVSLRLPNVISTHRSSNHFAWKVVTAARSGLNLELFDDGLGKRSFIDVENLAEVIVQNLFYQESPNILNVPGELTMTIKEFVAITYEKFGFESSGRVITRDSIKSGDRVLISKY